MTVLLGAATFGALFAGAARAGTAGATQAAPNLFVANERVGTITSYPTSSNGNVSPSATVSAPASLGSVYSLAIDRSGDLWAIGDDTVVEFTPGQLAAGSGAPTPAVTVSSTAGGSLDEPEALAFDAAGDLWVANYENDTVVEFTPGQLTAGFGAPTPAVTLDSLDRPDALAFDSSGDLWVANQGNNTVVEFTPGQLAMSGTSSPAPAVTLTSGRQPGALAFDSAGDLWVANSGNNTVVEFTPGELTTSGASSAAPTVTLTSPAANSLNAPYALAFDSAGDLWVVNYGNNTVVEFTPGQLTTAGTSSPAPIVSLTSPAYGSLNAPQGMAFDSAGDLWVAVFGNNTLVKFTPDELRAAALDPDQVPELTLSSTPFAIDGTIGLAFDSSGDLWSANNEGNTVIEFTPGQLATGAHTPAVTLSSTAAGSLDGPRGLAFDSSGDLWVANQANSTVAEFTPDELTASGSPAPAATLASGIDGPTALAFASSGQLWVANWTDNNLVGFAPGQLAGVSPVPTVTLTSTAFNVEAGGMAFDSSGDLWVSDSEGSEVVELAPGQLTTTGPVTPAATIAGASTGLDFPTGMAIAPASPEGSTTTTTVPTTTTTTVPGPTTTTAPATTTTAPTTTAATTTSTGHGTTSPPATGDATPTPPHFPGAGVSEPDGAIVDFGTSSYVLAGGRAFAAPSRALKALEKVDRAKVVSAPVGTAAPTALAPRAGTLLTTRAVDGDPTVYVVGPGGDLYGFASPRQFGDGGFDAALTVTVPSVVALQVSSTSAGAAGITAFGTSADGAIVDSKGTFYVFAGGRAFGIPTPSDLSQVEKADPARVLNSTVTFGQTSAPIAGGALLSVAGGHGVFVSYGANVYLFKTMAQLATDGYGGTAAVPVPGAGHLTNASPYSGS